MTLAEMLLLEVPWLIPSRPERIEGTDVGRCPRRWPSMRFDPAPHHHPRYLPM